MAPPSRETINVHWPMTIPENASFAISSPRPIQLQGPYPMQIHADSPIHIYCNRELTVIPAGPPTQGFARGWLKLPVELKLAILRHNLIFSVAIWPSNVNAVIRNLLLPYLRMTPEIAMMVKTVFYHENEFVVKFSSSTPRYDSASIIPPMSVRSQLRRIKFLTRLTAKDWLMLRRLSKEGEQAGFINLVHLQVRCLLKEAAIDCKRYEHGNKRYYLHAPEAGYPPHLWGPPVKFPFDGEVLYDYSGYDSTGNGKDSTLTWMNTMKHLVDSHISFNNK